MTERTPSKDEALEALDFIVNVLKEHEKDLDRLVSELGNVAGQLGETGEINGKVKKIEDKINILQNEIGSLVKGFAASPRDTVPSPTSAMTTSGDKTKVLIAPSTPVTQANAAATVNANPTSNTNLTGANTLPSGIPLTLQCSQWEDFQTLSNQAQTISFRLKENEKAIDITAIKNNHIITYSGQIPNYAALLKTWISKQLNTSERLILEGNITPR